MDERGIALLQDGETQGELVVRWHFTLEAYFRSTRKKTLQDGWFNTGDVATLDGDGFLTIKDGSKNIIKSGGEWISSVALDSIAIEHPKPADAAVIGALHDKWGEGPVVIAAKVEGEDPNIAEFLLIFKGKVSKSQIPETIVFTDVLLRNATGILLVWMPWLTDWSFNVLQRKIRFKLVSGLCDAATRGGPLWRYASGSQS